MEESADYQLENLGPERFEEVCQALLAAAYPGTQCFAVGQRDGGRDAITLYSDSGLENFIVFQVKYVRRPMAEPNPHEWVKAIVKEDAPKVRELIHSGAAQYYLLTNVPRSAYPVAGSMNTVQQILSESIGIPGQCWWRDDINRRLDVQWHIKWAYPDILSGPDMLRCIIENGLAEDPDRRASALRTFLRDQYERDTEVRFKQVELQNRLLDLFIDVPLDLQQDTRPRPMKGYQGDVLREILQRREDKTLGAATFLLHSLAQKDFSRVVIEGRPGQGKSTIVQYVCQIHRQRILGIALDDARIPREHRHSPVRLPLKVDCTDLSAWLDRKNPFLAEGTAELPKNWQKSLESFLAAQIQHYSGGVEFTVFDLQAVMKLSAALLVFDGLDEVADIGRRTDVVDHILKGVSRLREIALSIQTIVTSRPAAFENCPGMPKDTFRYFSLTPIGPDLIEQYAQKWLRARRLDGKEAAIVQRTLRDKLDQPHRRELARNPMQLAILLSSIQTRGGVRLRSELRTAVLAFLAHIVVACAMLLMMLGFTAVMQYVRVQLGLEGVAGLLLRLTETVLSVTSASMVAGVAAYGVLNVWRCFWDAASSPDKS